MQDFSAIREQNKGISVESLIRQVKLIVNNTSIVSGGNAPRATLLRNIGFQEQTLLLSERIEQRQKKWVSYLHRTATTTYPCCLPALGDSAGAGRTRLTHGTKVNLFPDSANPPETIFDF